MISTDGGPRPDADGLLLPESVRRTLRERADRGAPEEVCGVLVGERVDPPGDRDDPAESAADPDPGPGPAERVTRAVAVENVAATPETRYELDPAAAVDAVEAAEARGERAIGFYHSHPRGPAHPSETDRAEAAWRGYVYCLVAPDDVSAYRWTGERFVPLRVAVETR